MSRKKKSYEACCDEILVICELFPGWNFSRWMEEEEIDITNENEFYNSLKSYRQQLEIDNHVFMDDEETRFIMEEGLRIHSAIIKQQMYGED